MKPAIPFLFFLVSGLCSFSQDLAEYLDVIRLRDKNDSLVKKFDLGTAPREIPAYHYFKVEYVMNSKNALENGIALALENKESVISYKSFVPHGFPVLFYLGTKDDFASIAFQKYITYDEFPLSSLPISFPESYSVAAVNEKTNVHIAIYKFSPANIRRIDSLKAAAKGKQKDGRSRDEKVKQFLKKEEDQHKEKETRKAEIQKFNDNTLALAELEKQVGEKYISGSKIKKKNIYNTGYEILYLKHLKLEIGEARLPKDKIAYQNRAIALLNKLVRLYDTDTRELEKKLDDQTGSTKIQGIFDAVP